MNNSQHESPNKCYHNILIDSFDLATKYVLCYVLSYGSSQAYGKNMCNSTENSPSILLINAV